MKELPAIIEPLRNVNPQGCIDSLLEIVSKQSEIETDLRCTIDDLQEKLESQELSIIEMWKYLSKQSETIENYEAAFKQLIQLWLDQYVRK